MSFIPLLPLLLLVHLNRRADLLKVEVELVDKIENSVDITPLGFLLPGGQLDYYVDGGQRVSGVANRLQPDALVGLSPEPKISANSSISPLSASCSDSRSVWAAAGTANPEASSTSARISAKLLAQSSNEDWTNYGLVTRGPPP
jgi:hypothetical protein